MPSYPSQIKSTTLKNNIAPLTIMLQIYVNRADHPISFDKRLNFIRKLSHLTQKPINVTFNATICFNFLSNVCFHF